MSYRAADVFVKSPSEVLTQSVDFSDDLGELTITQASLSAVDTWDGAAASIFDGSAAVSGGQVTLTVTGGEAYRLYEIEVKATLSNSNVISHRMYMRVR